MAANSSFAVVFSVAKYYHGHNLVVHCWKCTYNADVHKCRPYGVPFRLNAEGIGFIFDDSFLKEKEIKEGALIEISNGYCFSKNTGFQLEVSEIIRHLKFNEGVVVFRGIADAFPEATTQEKGISQNNPLVPFHGYVLISVLRAVVRGSRIIALTRLKEGLNLTNRTLYCDKNSSIEEFQVPIREPVSDEDVGDVILVALCPKPERYHKGYCEGILFSASASDEDNLSPIFESEFYKMESRPRGFCLIFNNTSFKDKNFDRHGANFDEEKLRDLFGKLHFEVCVAENTDKQQMEQICKYLGGEDHSQYDAFVCVIMSHGTSGDKIMGVDGRAIGIEDLMSEFNAVRCTSLANKPKIFLVQACRGSQQGDSPGPNDQQVADDTFSDSTLSRSRLPKESDFLLAYGSVPGYVSYRRTDSGSFFIQTLVDVFEKKHHKDHLEDMLIEVRRKVSGAVCQVSPSHTTLRSKVFL